MTTPNIVMPYGYTVGGAKDMHWLTSVTGTSANIDLVEGPCRVVASWAGPESVALTLIRGGERTTLDTIEKKAGGGLAILGWSRSALSRATKCAWRLRLAPQRTRRGLSRFTPYQPTDLRGGGVGVHTIGESAGDQVVRGVHRGRAREFDRLGKFLRTASGRCVHGHGRLAAVKADGAFDLGHERRVPLQVGQCGGWPSGDADQRGRAERRNTLPACAGVQSGRRGSDRNHLPAGVAAGGGISK